MASAIYQFAHQGEYRLGVDDFPSKGLLQHFNEPSGTRGLEIGANEEWLCAILTQYGYQMTGVDARPFSAPTGDQRIGPDDRILRPIWQQVQMSIHNFSTAVPFDFALSVSAIEHFGLRFYEGDGLPLDGDRITMDRVQTLVKPGGRFYVTVPIGTAMTTDHWRRYAEHELHDRIIRSWRVRMMTAYRWGPGFGMSDTAEYERPLEEAFRHDGQGCDYEVLLILENPT